MESTALKHLPLLFTKSMHALPRSRLRYGRVLLVALVGYLFAATVILAARTLREMYALGDVNYPDSAIVYRIAQFAREGALYPDFTQSPYLPTAYGPFFYMLMAGAYWIAELAGLVPMLTLRAVELLFFLACVLLVCGMTRSIAPSAGPAWLSILIAASATVLHGWTVQIRPDFVGLAFALGSVALCLRSARPRVLLVAGLSAGLALLCKMTFASAPSACVLWLLWQKRWTSAALLASAVLSVTLVGYGVFLWREPMAWQHLMIYLAPLYDTAGTWKLLAKSEKNVLLPLLLGYLVLWRRLTSHEWLLVLYAAHAWLVATVTARQIGANVNYFFEPLMASAPIAAVAAWWLNSRQAPMAIVASAGVALLLASLAVPDLITSYRNYRTLKERPETLDRWSAFRTAVEGKRILSEAPFTAVWSSRPELLDPFLSHMLEKTGRWDPAPVIEDLRRQAYDIVMVYKRPASFRGLAFFSSRIQAAITHLYVPYCTWAWRGRSIVILLPKREGVAVEGVKNALLQAGCQAEIEETGSPSRLYWGPVDGR